MRNLILIALVCIAGQVAAGEQGAIAGGMCNDDQPRGNLGGNLVCVKGIWKPGHPCSKDIVGKDGTVMLCKRNGNYAVGINRAEVARMNELPTTSNVIGDVRKVASTGRRFIWDGDQWRWIIQ